MYIDVAIGWESVRLVLALRVLVGEEGLVVEGRLVRARDNEQPPLRGPPGPRVSGPGWRTREKRGRGAASGRL
jgi:hypothetical protein